MTDIIKYMGGGGGIFPMPKQSPRTGVFTGYKLPPLAPEDGTRQIYLPTNESSGTLKLITETGATVWSLSPSDIHANATNWDFNMFWLDSADAELWVIAYASATGACYVGRVNLATGGVTYVGTFDIGTWSSASSNFLHRPGGDGVGDFSIYYGNPVKKYVISAVDASIVSGPTDIVQNGVILAGGSSQFMPEYITAAENLFMISTGSNPTSYILYRGGRQGYFSGNLENASQAPTLESNIIVWAGLVVSMSNSAAGFYSRADYDDMLHRMADAIGLPAAA